MAPDAIPTTWGEEEQKLKEKAIRFALSTLNDDMVARDRDCRFSRVLWEKCADFGIQGLPVPSVYGGQGFTALQALALLEGLGYGCKDNGLLFSLGAQLWACTVPVLNFGSHEQKQKYLPALCSGKSIGAHAITEPQGGSDLSSISTEAVPNGNSFVINGKKGWVTNAPIADVFLVYARTGPPDNPLNLSCFLMDRNHPGMSIGNPIEKMGLRTSPLGDVVFKDCVVDKSALLGDIGAGSSIFSDTMEWERTFILAPALGAMERIADRCREQCRLRFSGKKSIGSFQGIAGKIVEMEMGLEAARLLIHRSAMLKQNKTRVIRESAMAKLFASEAYVSCAREAIQIFGAYGYSTECELERELRDACAATLYSGTSEIQKEILYRYSRTWRMSLGGNRL